MVAATSGPPIPLNTDAWVIIRSIRSINPAVAVLTLLTLGNAQTRLALLSLTRKVRVQKEEEHLVDVPQYICPLASCAP